MVTPTANSTRPATRVSSMPRNGRFICPPHSDHGMTPTITKGAMKKKAIVPRTAERRFMVVTAEGSGRPFLSRYTPPHARSRGHLQHRYASRPHLDPNVGTLQSSVQDANNEQRTETSP